MSGAKPPRGQDVAEAKEQPAEAPRAEQAEEAQEPGPGLVRIEFDVPTPGPYGHGEMEAAAARLRRGDKDLEPPPRERKPHPPLLAPKGTRNVALKKPVTSSDKEPMIGELAQVTDGDRRTGEGNYVELASGPQWVQIDLQGSYDIHAILFWHFRQSSRYYHDVAVQVSNDPDFAIARTLFNNDRDNSAGQGIGKDMHYTETNEGKLIDLLSQGSPKARYIRLYSNGNTSNELNHYIEVDVYGKPVE